MIDDMGGTGVIDRQSIPPNQGAGGDRFQSVTERKGCLEERAMGSQV